MAQVVRMPYHPRGMSAGPSHTPAEPPGADGAHGREPGARGEQQDQAKPAIIGAGS